MDEDGTGFADEAHPYNEKAPWESVPRESYDIRFSIPEKTRRELLRAFRERIRNSDEPVPFITKITVYDETESAGEAHPVPQAGQEGFPAGNIFAGASEASGAYAPHPETLQNTAPAEGNAPAEAGEMHLPGDAMASAHPPRAAEGAQVPDHTTSAQSEPNQTGAGQSTDPEGQGISGTDSAESAPLPTITPPRASLRTDSPFVPIREYKKPDTSLLVKSHERIDEDTRAHMHATADQLEKTFYEFGIEARVTNICRGPVITQYEISVPPGIRLSKVVTLQDNIALNLAASSVRIEAPIPGKSAIGIEVPNKKRSVVTLRDILESPEFQSNKARIPLALGQTVSGAAIVADLASMPHLIIAGTTGSGKSVCVNAIICSILYTMKPDQVRFILVDPKYVEMAPYNGIPHLLIPVVNKPRAAILALKWLVGEMEERYQRLQALGARSIQSYNERLAADSGLLDRNTGAELEHMPYLVLVIDELADLMLLAAKEIEDSISRLAAMSRAVGIHLIFATQRPSVDVLTGVIKNNFPARIAFQVASNIDSRTILDAKGADKLLGKGDSLFVGPGSPAARRVQGAFLSEGEVEKTAAYLRSLGSPLYRMEILDEGDDDAGDADTDDYCDEDDPLYDEAIQIVITTQRASASYLQRRLKVGYNRAARMVERMEKDGVVGPQVGAKPREILITSWP
jgi:S-DNA-T family DNA segregation ATPase FtsK/SpoIIIE